MEVRGQFDENFGYVQQPDLCSVPGSENFGYVPLPLQQQDVVFGSVGCVGSVGGVELNQMNNQNRSFGFDGYSFNGFSSSSSSSSTVNGDCLLDFDMSQVLNAQLELQRQEIDCILQLQSERLSTMLEEQRKNQMALMLKTVETKAMNMMKQKEQDLILATNRTMALESCLRETELENQTWKTLAKENENRVNNLSHTLNDVKQRFFVVKPDEPDANSFCGSNEEEENNKNKVTTATASSSSTSKLACNRCNSRKSCMLFLPCRHLCSCKHCEPFLVSCPICKSGKEASMEVLWV